MKVKRYLLVCMTLAVVLGCSVASVRADDIYPPPWERGHPNTTLQDWTFSSDANPSAPDVAFYNLYGTPQATITGTGNTWFQFYDNHNGVWALGGPTSSMDLGIPNTPLDDTKTKDVWTQITWEPNGTNEAPVVMVNGIASESFTNYSIGDGGWFQSVYQTHLAYNPQYEDVVITGSYDLGEVVVDTQCIPEPSSLALLAMGAISLLPYAWRKRRLAA